MKARLECIINDEKSGRKIPARVSAEDMKGNYYSPSDALSYGMNMPPEWPSDWGIKGKQMYFYANGEFSILVPVGIVAIRVTCGYEYKPFDMKIKIPSGGKRIEVKLERLIDMSEKG